MMMGYATDGRAALVKLMQEHTHADVHESQLRMVAEGASGRCIMRSEHPACEGLIGVYWGPERADNASFLPAAHGLRRAGVQVPEVLAERDLADGYGACLVEDLGRQSLLSLRGEPWAVRYEAYAAALRQLHRLHGVEVDWLLQPPFDVELYLWEQEYFAEHYLKRHRGLDAAAVSRVCGDPAWCALAEMLSALPRCPLHRDCQSQNIMMRDGEAWFIDFQGMRYGLPEYDLASLLYDPYMELSVAERAALLEEWQRITCEPLREDVYAACAMQRLMQALGAFANIGYNAHNPWYLQMIPVGERALQQVCASAPKHSLAARLAQCLKHVVTFSV